MLASVFLPVQHLRGGGGSEPSHSHFQCPSPSEQLRHSVVQQPLSFPALSDPEAPRPVQQMWRSAAAECFVVMDVRRAGAGRGVVDATGGAVLR